MSLEREREISQAISEMMMISNVHANSGGSGERASYTHRRTLTHTNSLSISCFSQGLERDRQRATSFASSNRGREAKALTDETERLRKEYAQRPPLRVSAL